MSPTLETLPVDIHFIIFKYLSPLPPLDVKLSAHPYFAISATSKILRAALDSFTGHLLLTLAYQHRTKVQKVLSVCAGNYRKSASSPCVLLSTYMRFAFTLCFFCGKKSSRRAIMDPGVICCANCDKQHYGEKITMTEAMKQYHLKKEDLFGGLIPHNLGGPVDPPEVSESGIIFQRPGLKYGQYVSNSVFTTMFLKEDVKSLACQKHGTDDLDGHRRQMREKYVQKQAKAELNRRNKIDYLWRLAVANGLQGDIAERLYKWSNRRKLPPLQLIRNELLLKKLGLKAVDHYWGTNPQPWSEGKPSRCWYYIKELLPANECECERFCEWEGWTKYCYYRYERRIKMRRYDNDHNPFQHIYQYKQLSGPGSKLVFCPKTKVPVVYCSGEDGELEDLLTSRKVDVIDPSEDGPWIQRVGGSITEPKFNPSEKKVVIAEWFDPLDKCLFEAFVKEFVMTNEEWDDESVDSSCGALRRDITPTGFYSKMKQPYITQSVESPIDAPWSWANYPVYVQDVVFDNIEDEELQNMGGTASTTGFLDLPQKGNTITVRAPQDDGPDAKGKGKAKSPSKPQIKSQKRAAAEKKVAKRNEDVKELHDRFVEHIKETLLYHGIEYISHDGGKAWQRDVVEPFVEEFEAEVKKGKKGKGKEKEAMTVVSTASADREDTVKKLRRLSHLLGYRHVEKGSLY